MGIVRIEKAVVNGRVVVLKSEDKDGAEMANGNHDCVIKVTPPLASIGNDDDNDDDKVDDNDDRVPNHVSAPLKLK